MTRKLFRTASLSLCALAVAAAASAQTAPLTYPDTPAGKKMALYQEALASGDPEVLRTFMKAYYPRMNPNDGVDQHIQINNQSGGFEPFAVDPRSTPTAIAVKVKSRFSGKEFQQVLSVEAAPPHIITALGLADGGYDVAGIPGGKALTTISTDVEFTGFYRSRK